MQTNLAPEYQNTPDGLAAEAILRKCVHCGFCTATCPTYQLLGDELDGPRGRIYLMRAVAEGERFVERDRADDLVDLVRREHLGERAPFARRLELFARILGHHALGEQEATAVGGERPA